ncbi:MAG: 30S ribosomal protein S20 [Patescibacteria group bacterium]
MPIKKAAFKDLRQTKKKTAKNLQEKQSFKYLLKQTRKAIEAKNKAGAAESLKKAIKALDKAAQHNLLKKNTASRYKSRLTKKVNALK